MLLAKTLRSSTLKLALICIGIFGAVVVVLFGFVYLSAASYVEGRSDRAIAAEHALLRKTYDDGGRAALIEAIARRLADQRLDGGVYLLADASFAPIAGNLARWPAVLAGGRGWGNFNAPLQESSPAEPPLLRASFETLPNGDHLLVGQDIDELGRFAQQIKIALALSLALVFVLAGVCGVAVTQRTVGRIESINASSRAIMDSRLGSRIPLRGTRDEWDQLAQNLNLMLDRIEALMREIKQVTDNVAHDLRTPLARIRGRLEKACNAPRDAERDKALIDDTLADLDGVLRMFGSLMRIAQIEASDRTAAFRTVNLAEVAREVVELFDAAAEVKGVHLAASGDREVLVTGDRDLLFDAVSNLVDNAIKHGREAGRVSVTVTGDAAGAVMSVVDDGPGIPADEVPHVFKRFYRLERSRRAPGNGLGLSLVAAVARLHGARIETADAAPGLEIRLHFSESGMKPGDGAGA